MKPRPLTAQQQRVLSTVRRGIEAGGAPTLRELADELGVSQNGARDHLLALARKGVVRVDPYAGRGVSLLGVRTVTLVLDHDEAARAAAALDAAGLTAAAARLRGDG